MQKSIKPLEQTKWENIIKSIIAIAIGAFITFFSEKSGQILYTIIGIALVVLSIISLCRNFLFPTPKEGTLVIGIAILVLGVFFIFCQNKLQSILNLVFGLFVILDGALELENAFLLIRNKIPRGIVLLIISLIMLGFGAVTLFSEFNFLTVLMGIALIVDGLCGLIITLLFDKKIRELRESLIKADAELTE